MRLRRVTSLFIISVALSASAQQPPPFTPDPATVQRFGPGYRYPQAGWIVLHIEGAPYDRGVQHGRLLAPEIAAYLRCYAELQSSGAPTEGWRLTRTLANSIFLRGFDREFMEEMQGIADGASAAGARFDGRPIDLIDVAALNLWPELMTLDEANAATPTGLEGVSFPNAAAAPDRPKPDGHCSAFAATGKATRDGHAIIGHITMFELYPSNFYNVWLDIKPAKGRRLLMQGYPGGIYSGMDYYINDAGVVMVETTIEQTRFDIAGVPLASRARKALQYGASIDEVVSILKDGNNGLYNNEWLLADMKTDEIAMFELGTHVSKLWRSGKEEWFGDTAGFYWGCNNAKDMDVRLETIPAPVERPANMVWRPTDRDLKWVELYQANIGKIDEEFAKTAFTTAPLCAASSVDVKFTSHRLAKDLLSWAVFGPPLGRTWMPTNDELRKHKEVRPLVPNAWTILGPAAPLPEAEPALAIDLPDPASDHLSTSSVDESKDENPPTKPAWHGTILPAGDADIWLASAFAEYERIISVERGYVDAQPSRCLCSSDYDRVARSLFAARARYFSGVRDSGDVALAKVRPDLAHDGWFRIASGKGVLVMAELRRLMGDSEFVDAMDSFGRANAGKKVTTQQFVSHISKSAARDFSPFFEYWLGKTGLPTLELVSASACPAAAGSDDADGLVIRGKLRAHDGQLPASIEMTLETADDEVTQVVKIDAENGEFELDSPEPATRIVVDKYGRSARANGGQSDLGAFGSDLEHTLIIYGTRDDEAANREAAETCQKSLRTTWHNFNIRIKSESEASDADLKSNHLILVGRPSANGLTKRLSAALPIQFGPASFTVRNSTYAHADSAVLVACVNPENPRFAVNLIAGNSAAATLAQADELAGHEQGVEVRVFEAGGKTSSLVLPAPELTRAIAPPKASDSTVAR